MDQVVQYHRKNQSGTISFHGIADIFESENIKKCVLKAFNDKKANEIQLDFTLSERVDTSIWQILLSLDKSLRENGRKLILHPETSPVYNNAENAGLIKLFNPE